MKQRLTLFVLACLLGSVACADSPATADDASDRVTLDNGLLKVELRKASGQITAVHAMVHGKLTQISDPKARAGLYLDWNGGPEVIAPELKDKQPRAGFGGPRPEKIWVVSKGPDAAEVAVRAPAGQWNPFSVEYHYRLPRGERILYAWARYEHTRGMPAGNIVQTRLVFRGITGTELFTHHVVDDKRMGRFPTSPVTATLQDATTEHADGAIYTKYDNSAFTADYVAHGLWGHGVGMWVLWPSTEFCNGGPVRQDLTVHTDNVILAMFQSGHFGAGEIKFGDDEAWSKFCGPVAFYVNEASSVDAAFADATVRARKEIANWPYAWVKHEDYPLQRGTVRGKVLLSDGKSAQGAWAILSPVEEVDWARSARGYQFFSRVAVDGSFELTSVRAGKYKLNFSGADQPVDYQQVVEVSANQVTDLDMITWTPVAHGRALWQVGTFDRGTAEFMDGDNPRNYTRFMDYFKAFPHDVTYVIGKSFPKRDWFYAQWNWFNQNPRRTIRFHSEGKMKGVATLTVGIASREYASGTPTADVADRAASSGTLIVRLNDEVIAEFRGGKTGSAGYRSGSQDSQYVLESVRFDAAKLKAGSNDLTFEHAVSQRFPTDPDEFKKLRRPRGSVMYDAIRLEVQP